MLVEAIYCMQWTCLLYIPWTSLVEMVCVWRTIEERTVLQLLKLEKAQK